MSKRTRHGREQDEAAWRTAEVEMIYRLRAAGVRVPVPHHFVDGVLIMELITDAEGNPAPRLGDLNLEPAEATAVFERVLAEVIRMLASGVVHGDLSDFNVLMSADGPVIIDFPQAVNASGNHNARKLLVRDVDNLHRFLAKVIPDRVPPPFAQEMWNLYELGELTSDTKLSGRFRAAEKKVSTEDVSALIADAERDERRRRDVLGLRMRGGSDQIAAPQHGAPQRNTPQQRPPRQRPAQRRPPEQTAPQPRLQQHKIHIAPQAAAPQVGALPAKRKRRRRRRKPPLGPPTPSS